MRAEIGASSCVVQAEALEEILQQEQKPLSGVVNYELPLEEIVQRLGGRRTCSVCKAVWHLVGSPPRKKDVCDHCGGALYQREDDQPQSIRVRMSAYQESTLPMIQYYRQRGLLISIKADGAPVAIFQRTVAAFNGATAAEKEKHA